MHYSFWILLETGFLINVVGCLRTKLQPTSSSNCNSNTQPPPPSSSKPTKHGHSFRATFFSLLLLANVSRFLSIIIELFYFQAHQDVFSSPFSFTVIRTIPALLFASNYSLLVLFISTLVSNTFRNNSSQPNDPDTLSLTHKLSNFTMYAVYAILTALVVANVITAQQFQVAVYALIALAYALLAVALCFYSPSLLKVLEESPIKDFLMFRVLLTICLCVMIFTFRSFLFCLGSTRGFGLLPNSDSVLGVSKEGDALTYLFLELVPSSTLIIMLLRRERFKKYAGVGVGVGDGDGDEGVIDGSEEKLMKNRFVPVNEKFDEGGGGGGEAGYGAI
ncbi:hypothetical protein ScalyP_jg2718 [Parmales sp. scaly parma]|nr:hypothetical protein ScalyP_jg2718 [Parmales sp. scaly parma]